MDLNRGIDTATLAALAGHFHPVLAVYIDWPGDPVYAHTGVGTLSWNGHDYLGVGALGKIELPGDGFGPVPRSATITMTGLPPEIFDRLDDDVREVEGIVYFGATTEAGGNVLVGDLTVLFEGAVDGNKYVGKRSLDVIEHGLELKLGGGPAMRSTARITHSYEGQIADYPGDTAGRHLQRAVQVARSRRWPE